MAEKYFAELEGMWQQNRDSGLQEYFDFEPGPFPRPKALRGSDLVRELVRLAVLTKDTRFRDAFFALVEHGIIDRKFNFLPWKPQHLRRGRLRLELSMWANIYNLKSRYRLPLRRVCAELAARTGWPGTSFAAAVKDLELLYRRWHFDLPKNMTPAAFAAVVEKACSIDFPTTELEKSCCTSIPTTAAN